MPWTAVEPIVAIGQAGGTAVPLFAAQGVSPRYLVVACVRRTLMVGGAELRSATGE
jgi:hypothetical protein